MSATLVSTAQILIGLTGLAVGGELLVRGAAALAMALRITPLVIGLTVVAFGTSAHELAVTVQASWSGSPELAVGNVVGSNTFNILGCLGLTGLVATGGVPVAPAVLNFDLWVMLAVAIGCLPVFFTGREIARWEGGLFLAYYVAYTAYLLLAASRHAALGTYSDAMLWFVLPLTAATLLALLTRHHIHHRRAGGGSP